MSFLPKFLRKGGIARRVIGTAADKVVPKGVMDVLKKADELGVDNAIERALEGKRKGKHEDGRATDA